jgi:RNA polymerase sigma-70 factor, ECF subfamily
VAGAEHDLDRDRQLAATPKRALDAAVCDPAALGSPPDREALQSQRRRGATGARRDEAAMRLLDPGSLTRHTNRLYRAAWALCGSREDAEDLVQETFVRVLARPRMLRDEEAELAYLLRVLRNTFLTGRRDASRRPVTVATLEEVVATEPRPSVSPEKAREVGEVYEAIAELPEHFRSALVAVDLIGLSYREAAKSLDVREETITTRLFRARRLLAKRFAEQPPPKAPEETERVTPERPAVMPRTAPGAGRESPQRSLSQRIGP